MWIYNKIVHPGQFYYKGFNNKIKKIISIILQSIQQKQFYSHFSFRRDMQRQTLGNIDLAQTQFFRQNPFSEDIKQIKQLVPILENQLLSLKQEKKQLIEQSAEKQSKQNQDHKQKQVQGQALQDIASQSQTPNKKQDGQGKDQKQVKQLIKKIHQKQKQIQKCSIRLQLLQLSKSLSQLSPQRLDQLQKIFTHYCHYIFKSGKHVTFDRIQYQKSHLIMERFFAFVQDFHLNRFVQPFGQVQKQLVPKHQLVVIFKRSSSNSRNLQFSQFITALQKFALKRYQYKDTYQERRLKQERQRKRIKQINAKRQKQKQRMKHAKDQQERSKMQQEQRKRAEQQEERRKLQQSADVSNQGSIQARQQQMQQKKQESKQQRKQRKRKEKKKKKRSQKQGDNNNDSQNPDVLQGQKSQSNQNGNQNNDSVLEQLMRKDGQISNPNQQFSQMNGFNRESIIGSKDQPDPNLQQIRRSELFSLIKQQKVQILYRLIQLDHARSIDQKLRQYEKPLYKVPVEQRKQGLLNSSSISKFKETHINHGLRLGELKEKVNQRKMQKLKRIMSKSITDQKYTLKKKQDYQKYLHRAVTIRNKESDGLEHNTNKYMKKSQGVPLSLNMLNQSSQDALNALKLGQNIKRYLCAEQDDKIFLNQYGSLSSKMRSSNSSYLQRSPKLSVDIKRRAVQLQQAQKKNQQQKLQRFALQMYKNQHYKRRLVQRKK